MEAESTEQGQGNSASRSPNEDAQSPVAASEGSEIQGSKVEDDSGTDAREVEWQFDATELKAIESWLDDRESGDGLTVAPGVTRNLTDAYYDTKDWILYRVGYALRIRQRGKSAEATMKSISPATGGVSQRRELSESLENGEVSTLRKSEGKVGERLLL